MSLNPWSKQQVEQLIEEYKQHPILYCVKNKYYHNRKLRAVALNEILKKIKTIRPETREMDILKKMNGLRTNYGNERKKQLRSIKEMDETGDGEIYQPSLWYYDLLTFLNTNIVSREKYTDESEESRNGKETPRPQMEFHEEIGPNSAGYHSMSTSDPLSEPEIENETKFSIEEEPLQKKKKDDKICSERKEYSTDNDDDGWLRYLSTLLGQIQDKESKVLLRHKITKMMYDEIEKQFSNKQ